MALDRSITAPPRTSPVMHELRNIVTRYTAVLWQRVINRTDILLWKGVHGCTAPGYLRELGKHTEVVHGYTVFILLHLTFGGFERLGALWEGICGGNLGSVTTENAFGALNDLEIIYYTVFYAL